MVNLQIKIKAKIVLLSLLAWSVIIPVSLIASMYRAIINLILKFKYKEMYGGLLNHSDMVYFIPDLLSSWQSSIAAVMIIKCREETDILKNIRKMLNEKVFNAENEYPKLTSRMHLLSGYPFWIKHSVNVDDVVKPMKTPSNAVFDEEYLQTFAARLNHKKLLKNGEVLWNLHVSTEPLVDRQKDGFLRYVMVAHFHHSTADGTSLVALLIRLFGDASCQNYGKQLFTKMFKGSNQKNAKLTLSQNIYKSLKKLRDMAVLVFDVAFISLGKLLEIEPLRGPDRNALTSTSSSGEKWVVWSTESKPECLSMIKDIKNKEKCKFICVMITAILASFNNYFQKKSLPVPEKMTVIFPTLIDFPDMDPSKPVSLENKITAALFELPHINSFGSLRAVLKIIAKKMTSDINYSDLLIVKIMWTLMGNLPATMIGKLSGYENQTFALTNIPGNSSIEILNGCLLEKIIPVVPIMKGIGMCFVNLSYDDRLHLGFTIDRKFLTQEEAQNILDNILHYIKQLYVECQ